MQESDYTHAGDDQVPILNLTTEVGTGEKAIAVVEKDPNGEVKLIGPMSERRNITMTISGDVNGADEQVVAVEITFRTYPQGPSSKIRISAHVIGEWGDDIDIQERLSKLREIQSEKTEQEVNKTSTASPSVLRGPSDVKGFSRRKH
ncbi:MULTISPECIES: hypothetical protein [Haloferax]|uniref:Uncharacterized protein n=2 Tax=Haloferax TaxID=2251 RepID=A0A6G1Z7I9_9EURY|nr:MULTISPECIES: hypothetical protein [Haloferax]KAB1184828.1 hypothetical protein Hfx1149_17365 [Haloferax sp. CBA1149]MRW82463.1 hypothetical protein [Haloferax marinisediminis]